MAAKKKATEKKKAPAKKKEATKPKKEAPELILNEKKEESGVKMVKVKCLVGGVCKYGPFRVKLVKDKIISVTPEVKVWLAKCGKIY